MKKMMMKARSGVTLVELLVVILIVTILSVSMLPLLQPFVVESQYAAEAIPVIANLRTKIGLFQYDQGKLPCIVADDKGVIAAPAIETYVATDVSGSTKQPDATLSEVDVFKPASVTFATAVTPLSNELPDIFDPTQDPTAKNKHFASLCDIDYQELKGKRSKPEHYQYLVMRNGTEYAYFMGCFGDGNGLKAGTGYAVCEIVAKGHKYVGTWKRYKAVGTKTGVDEGKICFSNTENYPDDDTDPKHLLDCWVPAATEFEDMATDAAQLKVIADMTTRGWEF